MRRQWRLAVWIVVAAGIPLATLSWFWQIRGGLILNNDARLLGGWIGLSALLLIMMALLRTTPPDAIRLPVTLSRFIVLSVSIILHAAALALLWPALSEDVTRYRLDGRMWLARVSPYATPPGTFFKTHPPDAIDRAVPFVFAYTIYPPVAQAAFIAAARVEALLPPPPPTSDNWRALLPRLPKTQHVLALRMIFGLASVTSGAVLLAILARAGQSPWWAALFAWNPLVIVESAGMGHIDALGMMFVLIALLLCHRRSFELGGIALALACGVKPFAVLLLPFLWREGRLRLLMGFLPAVTVVAAPMILQRGWMDSAGNLSGRWEANGSIYELVKFTFGGGDDGRNMERAKWVARKLPAVAIIVAGAILWCRRFGAADAAYVLLLLVLLLSPLVYPWYLTWVIGLVSLVRPPLGWTGMVFTASVCVSYLLWHEPAWVLRGRTLLMEYLPVYIVGAIEAWRLVTSRSHPAT